MDVENGRLKNFPVNIRDHKSSITIKAKLPALFFVIQNYPVLMFMNRSFIKCSVRINKDFIYQQH